jgi:hypothetical protein
MVRQFVDRRCVASDESRRLLQQQMERSWAWGQDKAQHEPHVEATIAVNTTSRKYGVCVCVCVAVVVVVLV